MDGAGLGLRHEFIAELIESKHATAQADFLEIAPENWMAIGGLWGHYLQQLQAEYPIICHGLSLSLGSPDPLDYQFINQLKSFLAKHQISHYSEHLSYCSCNGHLYELLPIPFTEEAVNYVADRINIVQDILETTIAIENISYYFAPAKQVSETDFIKEILAQTNCKLLLDINNVYVNSNNHHYDAAAFIKSFSPEQVSYFHIAGHLKFSPKQLIDTHGADVIEPVWQLLDTAYAHLGPKPTLLERDTNIPPLAELMNELSQIKEAQQNIKDSFRAQHYE